MLGGSIILAGALWLAFVTTRAWEYLFGFGVLIGTGMGFGTNVPVATAISRWFRRYRGRAMAIALTASGMGGFIGSLLVGKVMANSSSGFRAGWIVVAVIAVAAILIAYFFIEERPEDLDQIPDGEEPDLRSSDREELRTARVWTPNQAYRTPAYWLIVIGSTACQYPLFFLVAHWVLYLRGVGMTAMAATWAMSVLTLVNIGGRLAGGWLMDVISARYAFALGLGAFSAGILITLTQHANRPPLLFAATVMYGVGFGCSFICMNTITGNYFSHMAVPRLNGMMMLISAMICAPAGFIGGVMFDKYGSYRPAMELNLVVLLIGLLAVTMAKMPRRASELGNPT